MVSDEARREEGVLAAAKVIANWLDVPVNHVEDLASDVCGAYLAAIAERK